MKEMTQFNVAKPYQFPQVHPASVPNDESQDPDPRSKPTPVPSSSRPAPVPNDARSKAAPEIKNITSELEFPPMTLLKMFPIQSPSLSPIREVSDRKSGIYSVRCNGDSTL